MLGKKDGDPMPASVTLPASLTANAGTITLVGGDSSVLPGEPAVNGTIKVTFPKNTKAPCADAWAIKITPSE